MANCNDPAIATPQYPQRYDQNTVLPYISLRPGSPKNVQTVCILMLRYNRMAYCKSRPGDCGAPSGASGVSPYVVAGDSAAITGAGFGIAGAIGGAGSAAAGAAATATLVLAPIGIAIGVLGAISAHHKQAVITEQATLCQVVTAWNQVMDNLEPAVASGKVSLQQAIQYVQNAHDTLANILHSIEKTCNAACYYHSVLDSMLAFNKKYVLPSLLPNQQTVTAPQGQAGAPSSLPSAALAPADPSGALKPPANSGATYLAAAGLIGAKLAGVY